MRLVAGWRRRPPSRPLEVNWRHHLPTGTGVDDRVRRWWPWWAAAGCAFLAGYLTVPTDHWLSGVLFDTFAATSVIVMVVGVRRNRPVAPALWYLLAGGQLLWAFGDVLFNYYDAIGADPFPSPADVLYLAAYPLLGAGLLMLVRRRSHPHDRGGLIDASIVATGVTLLAWVYVLQPLASNHEVPLGERVISVAYPAADLLLLVVVIRLFTTHGARTASYWLLVGSLLSVLFADIVFTALISTESSYLNYTADLLWLASYLSISLAALHPSMVSLTERGTGPTPRLTPPRLAVLAAASMLAPAVLCQQGLTDPHDIDWAPVALGAVLLFVLVVLRMAGLMSRVQQQSALLSAMAHLDGLTGVANRRAWDKQLAATLSRAGAGRVPVSLALLDLDHFKRFNDEHGHLAGDQLLRDACSAWQDQLRSGDLLARYGGEEFGVLLPGTTLGDASVVVDRMRVATPFGQSFSAGVVCWDGVEGADELIARADEALYAAKRAGRNRVVGTRPG